jgi:hypothetical protein
MTRASIREYTEAVRWRYLSATKKGKGKILDEFIQVIGYHRKAAIRLLHRVNQPSTSNKRGRPRQYSAGVVGALRLVWEATSITARLRDSTKAMAANISERLTDTIQIVSTDLAFVPSGVAHSSGL